MVAPSSNNLSSISTTEFGTKLSGMGKLVRFGCMERDSWIKKGAAVAITGVALAALMASGAAAMFITGKALVASTAVPFIAKVGGVASLIFASIGAMVVPGFYFYEAFKRQQPEQEIIQALGGKEVFDTLPVLRNVKIGVTGYLDRTTPEDVKHQPITKGVDERNRPFVAFYLKNVRTEEVGVVTFFQESEEIASLWKPGTVGTRKFYNLNDPVHAVEFLEGMANCFPTNDFAKNIEKIKQLVADKNPVFKLIRNPA